MPLITVSSRAYYENDFKQPCIITAGADPGFCEGGFEGGFVNSLKGTFEQK